MKRSKIFLFLLLEFIEMLSLFLTYKSFSNKEIDKVKEINKINNKQFSMFIETDNGYDEYLESNKFPEGYTINLEESKCLDTKGNVIEGILSGSGTNITVISRTTSYCYLYFDIPPINAETLPTTESDIWQSTLEDDGYRYIGTDPNNYVCFGYDNVEEDCDFTSTTNTDLYAYRIIGIFEDGEGTPHIKLIKKEALNTSHAWHANPHTDIDWDASNLYKGINGSYFLTNTTYSYMQDTNWTNKIAEWNYTATNTKTYENYNSTNGTPYGSNYYYSTVKTIYLHEMNSSGKTNQICYYNSSTTADCSVGEWKYATDADWDKSEVPKVKISLMYASDYLLSLGSSALEYAINSKYSTLKTGWMHISNNDSGAPIQYEWTVSRYGFNGYSYGAWCVSSDGHVGHDFVYDAVSVRPVFYLTSDVELSGEGTIGSPYIIS